MARPTANPVFQILPFLNSLVIMTRKCLKCQKACLENEVFILNMAQIERPKKAAPGESRRDPSHPFTLAKGEVCNDVMNLQFVDTCMPCTPTFTLLERHLLFYYATFACV